MWMLLLLGWVFMPIYTAAGVRFSHSFVVNISQTSRVNVLFSVTPVGEETNSVAAETQNVANFRKPQLAIDQTASFIKGKLRISASETA